MTTPPAATSVRIDGKDLPIPIDCKPFFERDADGTLMVYFPSLDGGMFIVEQLEPDSPECMLCAAVAARHYRNKQTKLVDEIEEVAFGIQAINGCDWSRHTELHELLTYCGKAAEQWEELCNQL